jgi:hypothetical protein
VDRTTNVISEPEPDFRTPKKQKVINACGFV